ncbi:PglL family O-oligosaccharyltransferase [Pantoea sp. Z09]|uniref:PglL family O-oligosaccharyltransferase n=1 Tax=Pantoea sp. Z09 TaxID=2886821 RepID=UPI001EFC4B5B|nr:O-antigen ligase family protein [Pantoea sp. Z09]
MRIKNLAGPALSGVLGLYFIAMHRYQANMGGSGLTLPLNILSWIAMLSIVLLATVNEIEGAARPVTRQGRLMTAAVVLMTLPLLWTPALFWQNALPRLAGLWGALLVSLALQRLQLSQTQKQRILAMILLAALLEAALSLFQAGWPEQARQLMEYNMTRLGGRPYGIFQQPNLLASFLASGYAIAVWFAFALRREGLMWWALLGCQMLLILTLLLAQSRVGAIGAVSALLLLSLMSPDITAGDTPRSRAGCLAALLLATLLVLVNAALPARAIAISAALVGTALLGALWRARRNPVARRRQAAIFLVGLLTTLLFCWPHGKETPASPPAPPVQTAAGHDFVHLNSTLERITLLRGTLALIAQHPWRGSGLGSFEQRWPDGRAHAGLSISNYITHPHNELLYVWAEGGVVALAGFLLLLCSILRTAFSSDATALAAPTAAMLLPILLHTQLEYPLYQSAAHLLLLLLFIRIGQPEPVAIAAPGNARLRLALCGPPLLAAILLLAQGLGVQQQLTQAERHGLRALPALPLNEKITQYQRYDFDQHSALLIDYNRSRNPRDLQRYLAWSQRYLQVWQDAGVYDAAIRIARFEGKRREAAALAIRAQRAFPGDRRFRRAEQGGRRREKD